MRDALPEIRARGADLVIIGNGSRHFAKAFREDLELDIPILIDEKLVSYQAADFRRGGAELLSPRLFTNAARALLGGYRQRGVQGDAWQLGGILIVTREAGVVYRFASATAGDHPSIDEILRHLPTRT